VGRCPKPDGEGIQPHQKSPEIHKAKEKSKPKRERSAKQVSWAGGGFAWSGNKKSRKVLSERKRQGIVRVTRGMSENVQNKTGGGKQGRSPGWGGVQTTETAGGRPHQNKELTGKSGWVGTGSPATPKPKNGGRRGGLGGIKEKGSPTSNQCGKGPHFSLRTSYISFSFHLKRKNCRANDLGYVEKGEHTVTRKKQGGAVDS